MTVILRWRRYPGFLDGLGVITRSSHEGGQRVSVGMGEVRTDAEVRVGWGHGPRDAGGL